MANTFYLGTSIKISIITSIDAPNSVSVMVKDYSDNIVQAYSPATRMTDKVYEYVFQSSETNVEGEYTATVKIVYGAYTSIEKIKFNMEKD